MSTYLYTRIFESSQNYFVGFAPLIEKNLSKRPHMLLGGRAEKAESVWVVGRTLLKKVIAIVASNNGVNGSSDWEKYPSTD